MHVTEWAAGTGLPSDSGVRRVLLDARGRRPRLPESRFQRGQRREGQAARNGPVPGPESVIALAVGT